MLRALILISIVCLLPIAAHADDRHKDQTLVEVNGRVKWLDNEQIAGVPWWQIKVKCYKGAQVVGENELQVMDGFTGKAEGSGTTGKRNPYTGRFTPKTRISYFVYFDSRKPDPYVVLGQDPDYQDILAQVQAFTLGDLTLYVYSEGADRFEAEVYASQTPGYTLDRTQLIPLAAQNDDAPLTLFGKLSGELRKRDQPLYVKRPLRFSPTIINKEGRLMLWKPDGSYELVVPHEMGVKWPDEQ